MKTSDSPSAPSNEQKPDWTDVLFEIILKILTLGFYHLKRHRSNNGVPK